MKTETLRAAQVLIVLVAAGVLLACPIPVIDKDQGDWELLGDWYFFLDVPGSGPFYNSMSSTNTSFTQVDYNGFFTLTGTIEEYDNYSDTTYLSYDASAMGGSGTVYTRFTWEMLSDTEALVTDYVDADSLDAARGVTEVAGVYHFYGAVELVPPVLVLNGDPEMPWPSGQAFDDPGAYVVDWAEDPGVQTASDYGGMDTGAPADGFYTLTYEYTDFDGNGAEAVYRTVVVGGGTIEAVID